MRNKNFPWLKKKKSNDDERHGPEEKENTQIILRLISSTPDLPILCLQISPLPTGFAGFV